MARGDAKRGMLALVAPVLRGPLATTPASTFTTRVEASTDNPGGHPRYVPMAANRPGWTNVFQAGGCAGACHENPSLGFSSTPAMPPVCAAGGDVENCYH